MKFIQLVKYFFKTRVLTSLILVVLVFVCELGDLLGGDVYSDPLPRYKFYLYLYAGIMAFLFLRDVFYKLIKNRPMEN